VAILLHLALAFATIGGTVVLHLLGIALLTRLLDGVTTRVNSRTRTLQMVVMGLVVCGLFTLHMIEIGVYAAIYWSMGALSPFDDALYFSAVTFTTIGYGDVVVTGPWRLVAAFEGLTGITLAGWSVAFLVVVVRRLDQWQRGETSVAPVIDDMG